MEKLVKRRIKLYSDYIKELSIYDPSLADEKPQTIEDWALAYMGKAIWIDIFGPEETEGFLIIGIAPADCHPDCDYYIAQAYVSPEWRKYGLMTLTVLTFIRERPGVYGYDVIKGNDYADQFWKKLFSEKTTGTPVDLPRVRDKKLEDKLLVYGYRIPKWGETK